MNYPNIVPGIFLSRPNRFIARVRINGREETAHVKNTGRCRELLIPGAEIYLQHHDNPRRKTRFSLISVKKSDKLINIDSQAPNQVLKEALQEGMYLPGLVHPITCIRPESVFGNSRFDFYVEAGGQKAYIEAKGVTLERDGVAMFPDAPTERGVKHVRELILAAEESFTAYVFFVVQMKGICCMMPNDRMHAAFGSSLRAARKAGVHIMAYDCIAKPESLWLDQPVPVIL